MDLYGYIRGAYNRCTLDGPIHGVYIRGAYNRCTLDGPIYEVFYPGGL